MNISEAQVDNLVHLIECKRIYKGNSFGCTGASREISAAYRQGIGLRGKL